MLLAPVGCGAMLTIPAGGTPQSLLKAVETGPKSVTLEIFQVRIPAEDRQFADEIWSTIDEQRIDLAARGELSRNGFRVGVLGGSMPDVLTEQFQGDSKTEDENPERVITDSSASPRVIRRLLQLKRDDQATIQASELREQINVFISNDDGLQGKSYDEVQAAYDLRANLAKGQRALVRLTPELHHGQLRNRYAGSDQGIFLVTPSRERVAYDEMVVKTSLSAGELLVIGCQPESQGSLGWAFHGVDKEGPAEQKLVLIRLLQVPPSEILSGK